MKSTRTNVLFVCSRNQWRSPTAEHIYRDDPRFNVRSRGTSRSAKRKLVEADLNWADIVFVMERKHRTLLNKDFGGLIEYGNVIVLDIPDDYSFLDPELITTLTDRVETEFGRLTD